MKKSVFLLAAGAIALTACTQSEVVEEGVQSNVIAFKEVVGKNTRAIDNSNFTNFSVFGYYTKGTDKNTGVSVFNGDEVTKSGAGSSAKWEYTSTSRYWVEGGNYRFFAYSCDNNSVKSPDGTASMNLGNLRTGDPVFTIADYICHTSENGDAHDLIVAYNNETTEAKAQGNGLVSMKFSHVLSRLNIEFESGFPAGYEIKISDIKLINYCDQGTYSYGADHVWSDQKRSKKSPEFTFKTVGGNVAKADASPTKVTTDAAYVIPFAYMSANVKIQFAIDVTNPSLPADKQTILSTVLVGDWQPKWVSGTTYTYTVVISGDNTGMEKIEFTVNPETGVSGWATPGTDNQAQEIKFNVVTPSTPETPAE